MIWYYPDRHRTINCNFTDKTDIGIDSGGEYWLQSPGMGEIFNR